MGVKSFVPVTNDQAWHFHSPPKGRVRKGQKNLAMTYKICQKQNRFSWWF